MSSNKYALLGLLGGAGEAAAEIGKGRIEQRDDMAKLEAENAYREGIARLENEFAVQRQESEQTFRTNLSDKEGERAITAAKDEQTFRTGLLDREQGAADARLDKEINAGKFRATTSDSTSAKLRLLGTEITSLDTQLSNGNITQEDYAARRDQIQLQRDYLMGMPGAAADEGGEGAPPPPPKFKNGDEYGAAVKKANPDMSAEEVAAKVKLRFPEQGATPGAKDGPKAPPPEKKVSPAVKMLDEGTDEGSVRLRRRFLDDTKVIWDKATPEQKEAWMDAQKKVPGGIPEPGPADSIRGLLEEQK